MPEREMAMHVVERAEDQDEETRGSVHHVTLLWS